MLSRHETAASPGSGGQSGSGNDSPPVLHEVLFSNGCGDDSPPVPAVGADPSTPHHVSRSSGVIQRPLENGLPSTPASDVDDQGTGLQPSQVPKKEKERRKRSRRGTRTPKPSKKRHDGHADSRHGGHSRETASKERKRRSERVPTDALRDSQPVASKLQKRARRSLRTRSQDSNAAVPRDPAQEHRQRSAQAIKESSRSSEKDAEAAGGARRVSGAGKSMIPSRERLQDRVDKRGRSRSLSHSYKRRHDASRASNLSRRSTDQEPRSKRSMSSRQASDGLSASLEGTRQSARRHSSPSRKNVDQSASKVPESGSRTILWRQRSRSRSRGLSPPARRDPAFPAWRRRRYHSHDFRAMSLQPSRSQLSHRHASSAGKKRRQTREGSREVDETSPSHSRRRVPADGDEGQLRSHASGHRARHSAPLGDRWVPARSLDQHALPNSDGHGRVAVEELSAAGRGIAPINQPGAGWPNGLPHGPHGIQGRAQVRLATC